MSGMKLSVEKDALKRAEFLLRGIPGGMQTALMRSMNRALYEGRTAGTREVTKTYTAKAKTVRPTFAMHQASRSGLEAELTSRGTNLPLEEFTHKPRSDTTGSRRKQVRVAVRKGGLKPLGQGFIHQGKILQRLGRTSYPIAPKYGVSVPGMLNEEGVVDKVVDTLEAAVDKRLDHETRRLLNK